MSAAFHYKTGTGECKVCGVLSFDHLHPANSKPKDFVMDVEKKQNKDKLWTTQEILNLLDSMKYGDNPERSLSVMEVAYDLALENIKGKIMGE